MEQEFEEKAHVAACSTMGEAVWLLVASGETVSQEAIARMIMELSKRRHDLTSSIALSVLVGTQKQREYK